MKKAPVAFIKYLKKQIPVRHRTDAEADYTYRSLHLIIDNFLKDLVLEKRKRDNNKE